LNDCLALVEWARQHGYVLVRLPVVRGSRQSVNVKLATTILDNGSVCIKGGGQVRVGGVTRTNHRTAAPCRSQFRVHKSVEYSPTPRHAATSFVYVPSAINQNAPRFGNAMYVRFLFTPKRNIYIYKRTNLYFIAFIKVTSYRAFAKRLFIIFAM
jgi:hypothetical protein